MLAHPSAGHAGFRIPLLIASGLSATCALGLTLFLRESRTRTVRFSKQPSRFAVLNQAVSHPTIRALMLVTLLGGCAFNGIELVFGFWTAVRFHWGPQQVGWAFTAVGIAAAICQIFVTGPLSQRYGQATMLAVGMALTMACTFLQPFGLGGITVVPLFALAAFGQSVAWPNVSALISRHVDWEHQGQFLGLNNATGALARMIGPLLALLAFSNIAVDAPFFLAGLTVLPAIFIALLARRHPPPPLSEHTVTG